MAEEQRVLRIVFVGDFSQIDRGLDARERRAAQGIRVGASSGLSDSTVSPSGTRILGGGGITGSAFTGPQQFGGLQQGNALTFYGVGGHPFQTPTPVLNPPQSPSPPPLPPLPPPRQGFNRGAMVAGYAGINLIQKLADTESWRIEQEAGAPYRTRSQNFQIVQREAESEVSGISGLLYRASSGQSDWWDRTYNPAPALDAMRKEQMQTDRGRLNRSIDNSLREGNLANQSLGSAVMGNQYQQKLFAAEGEQQKAYAHASDVYDQLSDIGDPNPAGKSHALLDVADRRALLEGAMATRERNIKIDTAGIGAYIANLRGGQRDDAELLGLQKTNAFREQNEGDLGVREAMAAEHRATEDTMSRDLQRSRDIRQSGYATTDAVARAQAANNPQMAQILEMDEARRTAVANAPAGEKEAVSNAGIANSVSAFWISDRILTNQVHQQQAGAAQSAALLKGDRLGAELIGINSRRDISLSALPKRGEGGLFEGVFGILRDSVNAGAEGEAALAKRDDDNSRWFQRQKLMNEKQTTGLLAEGREKSAAAAGIAGSAQLQADAILRAKGPDALENSRAALQIGINQEKNLLRQFQLQAFGSPSSGQGIGPGGIGGGNQNQQQGVERLEKAIDATRAELAKLTAALQGVN